MVKPPPKVIFIFAGLLILVTVLAGILIKSSSKTATTPPLTFVSEIMTCNKAPSTLRFSCYRSVIEKYYKGDVPSFVNELKNDKDIAFEEAFTTNRKISYAVFGTNCHTFYHAAGDYIATYSKDDLKTMLSFGPTRCTNGYTMGLYKRIALKNNFSDDILNQFYTNCKMTSDNQCAHEIGHILNDKYTGYSLLKILDNISSSQYHLSYPQKYNYATFQNADFKPDFNKPFEICKEQFQERKLVFCLNGIGHNLLLYSEFSPDGNKSLFNECLDLTGENKSNCYNYVILNFGTIQAAPKYLSGDYKAGQKICDDVLALSGQPGLERYCYKGLGAGIGIYVDSVYGLEEITKENHDAIKTELQSYLDICQKVKPQFINNCLGGLIDTQFAKYYDQLDLQSPAFDKVRSGGNTN